MLKVGLIGCGFMGSMHANCYKNIEGVELTAVADIRKEKAEEIANGTNACIYGDGMDLLRYSNSYYCSRRRYRFHLYFLSEKGLRR